MNPARGVKFPQQALKETPSIIAGHSFAKSLQLSMNRNGQSAGARGSRVRKSKGRSLARVQAVEEEAQIPTKGRRLPRP